MLTPEIAGAFFLTALVMAIAPGPDNVFVLTQSALYGVRAGLATTFGLVTGLCAHMAAVACGVAALFQTSPTAFTVLKVVGAGYLVYLAWLSARSSAICTPQGEAGDKRPGPWALYRRGVIMNITNPKVTLFFLAFLPQFSSLERGSVPVQILLLGMLFQVATLLVFGTVALLGGRLAVRFNNSPVGQIFLNRAAAVIFVGLAGILLFSGS